METNKLEKLNACEEAIIWLKSQKYASEAWQNCERGDWMLWLAKRLNVDDKKLTMAKAMCAKQVEHLMKDQRSKDALQACFDYANGKITRKELNDTAIAANANAANANAANTNAANANAAYAAYAAAYAAYAAAYAAYAAYANAANANAANAIAAYAAVNAIAAYAAVNTTANTAVAAYAAYVRKDSLKKSADICREYLTDEVIEKYKKLR